jgi:hypothetical protein
MGADARDPKGWVAIFGPVKLVGEDGIDSRPSATELSGDDRPKPDDAIGGAILPLAPLSLCISEVDSALLSSSNDARAFSSAIRL